MGERFNCQPYALLILEVTNECVTPVDMYI